MLDYRVVNNKIRKGHYLSPLVDDHLERLAVHSLFENDDEIKRFKQILLDLDTKYVADI